MRQVNVNGHTLEVYEGIDELPIINFQKYNKCLLIDSGIGSDVDSVNQHIITLAKLIGTNTETDKEKVLTELENMQTNLMMICSEISPSNMAFAALVHSVDGEVVTDLSDSGLKKTLDKIKDVKQSFIFELLFGLKKNFSEELELYFPNFFGADSRAKEAFDASKKALILVYESIIHPEKENEVNEELRSIEAEKVQRYKPKKFGGKTSAEIQYDKQFESSSVIISQKTSSNAKSMTVLQYYTTLDIIKKQADAEQKAYKKMKR